MLFTARPSATLHAAEVTFSEVTNDSNCYTYGLEVTILNFSVESDIF